MSLRRFRDAKRDDQVVSIPAGFDNSVRIGYARVSTRAQDHQAQQDALAAAHCREIVVETASTRDGRPKLADALAALHADRHLRRVASRTALRSRTRCCSWSPRWPPRWNAT